MHAAPSPNRAPRGSVVSARVAVIGSGVVADTTLAALVTVGFRDFQLADWSDPETGEVAGPSVNRATSMIRAHGTERTARVQIRPGLDPSAPSSWSSPWLGACGVCLLCADVVDVGVALELNARCLERRVPLLAGFVTGTMGHVGPIVRPGDGPCLRCVDLRVHTTTGQPWLHPGPPNQVVACRVGAELATQVVRFLAGGATAAAGGVLCVAADGPPKRHAARRTWECPACSKLVAPPACWRAPRRGRYSDRDGRDRGRILRAERHLVDAVAGPIRCVERFEPGPRDPPLRHWIATLAEPAWASQGFDTVACGGTGLADDSARAAALGEALERMNAVRPAQVEPLARPYRDVAPSAVDPVEWDMFHPWTRQVSGFPYRTPGSGDAISWVCGYSITARRPLLVPASRVFLPAIASTPADSHDDPIVSGFATGSTWAEAALAGTLEVLERDAFMVAWRNRLPLPALEVDSTSPGEVGEYLASFERKGIDVDCRLIVLDTGVPVVIAMARSPSPGDPAAVLSAAADLDVPTACRRALAELAANRLHKRAHPGCDSGLGFETWWGDARSAPMADRPVTSSPSKQLSEVVRRLAAAGLQVIVVDLTPPWLRALGLRTVKALVPGTYPLHVHGSWPHLGGSRLSSAPIVAGLRATPLPHDALNATAPPFP